MIPGIINQIKVEGVIPAVWELCGFVNCYKSKGDILQRRNYKVGN